MRITKQDMAFELYRMLDFSTVEQNNDKEWYLENFDYYEEVVEPKWSPLIFSSRKITG